MSAEFTEGELFALCDAYARKLGAGPQESFWLRDWYVTFRDRDAALVRLFSRDADPKTYFTVRRGGTRKVVLS